MFKKNWNLKNVLVVCFLSVLHFPWSVWLKQTTGSILMLFYYLAPLQDDSIVTSWCMQFTFGDEREVYLLDKSALPVTEKESMQEEKRSIGPRMKFKWSICDVSNFGEKNLDRLLIFKNNSVISLYWGSNTRPNRG